MHLRDCPGTATARYLVPVSAAPRGPTRAGSAGPAWSGSNDNYPGSWHGWDLLKRAPFKQRAWSRVLRWIAAR